MKKRKEVFIVLFLIFIQALLYFVCKLFQGEQNLIISSFDSKIPFIPSFVYFYYIWYLMLLVIPVMLFKYDKKVFNIYCSIYIISILISDIIFMVYPTIIVRPSIEVNSFSTFLLNVVYILDFPPINCFPSIHCIICFIFIICSIISKGIKNVYKVLIVVLSILIVFSTVLIKQHVVYDIIGSMVVVIISYIVVTKFNLYKVFNRFYKEERKNENRNSK